MDKIWAPWRMEYLKSKKPKGCIFCVKPKEDRDLDNLILHRGKRAFVIMNRYPYTNGHLMIVPYLHTSDFQALTPPVVRESFALLQRSQNILEELMHPEGFNIGLNLGKVAGAGIHEHIHFHIVPRWNGDTNFMPVLAEARVISEHLLETYDKLLPLFRTKPKKAARNKESR